MRLGSWLPESDDSVEVCALERGADFGFMYDPTHDCSDPGNELAL